MQAELHFEVTHSFTLAQPDNPGWPGCLLGGPAAQPRGKGNVFLIQELEDAHL